MACRTCLWRFRDTCVRLRQEPCKVTKAQASCEYHVDNSMFHQQAVRVSKQLAEKRGWDNNRRAKNAKSIEINMARKYGLI